MVTPFLCKVLYFVSRIGSIQKVGRVVGEDELAKKFSSKYHSQAGAISVQYSKGN